MGDGKFPQWAFCVAEGPCKLPPLKSFVSGMNKHLSTRSVAESLPKEGWIEVEFSMDWEGKALQCTAMTLEPFAKYVRQRYQR